MKPDTVEEALRALKGHAEPSRLLFEWVKTGVIPYSIFKQIVGQVVV